MPAVELRYSLDSGEMFLTINKCNGSKRKLKELHKQGLLGHLDGLRGRTNTIAYTEVCKKLSNFVGPANKLYAGRYLATQRLNELAVSITD